jgi:hypothetical protein
MAVIYGRNRVAGKLPWECGMRKTTTGRTTGESRRVKLPTSDVVLWRPRIVLAPTVDAATSRRRRVTLEALASPAAPAPRLGTAAHVLGSLADARTSLAKAADARARAAEAATARDRVAAAMAAYRLEASFDQVLAGTYRQVTELMEERGLA